MMRSLKLRRPLPGHGQALLAFLYGLARSRESVFEVTVEDPAPGFEKVWAFILGPRLSFCKNKIPRNVSLDGVISPVVSHLFGCWGVVWLPASLVGYL